MKTRGTRELSGDEAFAHGALASGVTLVTGYPGSPSSGTVNALLSLTDASEMDIEWCANERIALETAIGASIAGRRVLVCVKSVGMNVMLDPLMALNLTPVHGGFVILLGDDPGAYGSQNDQDTRTLCDLVELPLFEPATPAEAARMVPTAYQLSEQTGLPIILRTTRAMSTAKERFIPAPPRKLTASNDLPDEPFRFVPFPRNAVQKHLDLQNRLMEIARWADGAPFNSIQENETPFGIISAGFTITKLADAVGETTLTSMSVLKLGTQYPLPATLVAAFLKPRRSVLVLEETRPFLESAVRVLAQREKLSVEIMGVMTSHLPGAGELFRWQIQEALAKIQPDLRLERVFSSADEWKEHPKKASHCDGCRYEEVLDLLDEAAGSLGKRLLFVGDPGCLATVADRLYAKYAIGSAIPVAAGLWRSQTGALPVALVGDSGFFHASLPALCNAVSQGDKLPIVVLDNGAARTSGGQPHPGSGRSTRDEPLTALSIRKIAVACGADPVIQLDLDMPRQGFLNSTRAFLQKGGLRVLVVRIADTDQSAE